MSAYVLTAEQLARLDQEERRLKDAALRAFGWAASPHNMPLLFTISTARNRRARRADEARSRRRSLVGRVEGPEGGLGRDRDATDGGVP